MHTSVGPPAGANFATRYGSNGWRMPVTELDTASAGAIYARVPDLARFALFHLSEHNRDQFSNRDEVFERFASAVITGSVLPIGRLIEKTFGKGSYRRLGKGETLVPAEPTEQPHP